MRRETTANKEPQLGTLYVVSTPIGNLQDISLRALDVLRAVDLIAAEDTRRTRKLLSHFDIHTPMTSCFAHNEQYRAPELVRELQSGRDIALVTSAGTPTISDPGLHTVVTAVREKVPVVPIPGPCAAIMALTVSGLPTNRFVFEGFLGRTRKKRKARLKELIYEKRTIIAYEAPHRIQKTLEDIHSVFGDRELVLARELTKKHEEMMRGTATELLRHFDTHRPRGEFTVVIRAAH